jgi:hypothetical protein
MKNLRLQELLTCVHAAGLGHYATALDPRLTYWPFHAGLLEKTLLGPTADKLAGADGQSLTFASGSTVVEEVNRLYFRYTLDVIAADVVRITTYNDVLRTTQTTDVAYTLDGGLSSPVPLGGSSIVVRFTEGVGAAWLVEALARPARPLVQVALDVERGLGSDEAAYLFPSVAPEPYATFSNLWRTHPELPFRLAGLALAWGYRTEALRE